MKSIKSGFVSVDLILGAAISAILFLAMVSYSSQMTDLMVGPGYITENGVDYQLSPSRVENSKKLAVINTISALRSSCVTILVCDGMIDPEWTTPTGRLEAGTFTPYGANPASLFSPTNLRNLLAAQGVSFSSGYTVFFMGNENRIGGILRVSSEDTTSYRLFNVSISTGTAQLGWNAYSFAEPIAHAQAIPSYTMSNLFSGHTPLVELSLPNPDDSFATRSIRLEGKISITRDGLGPLKLVLPIYL